MLARLELSEQHLVSRPGRPPYDLLLVDEAQDFLPREIALFRRLATDLFLVADSRQQIYEGKPSLDELEAVVDQTLPLTHHYRNGLPICLVADGIGRSFSAGYEPIAPTCNYNSAALRPSVDRFQGDIRAQAVEIARRLVLQRRTYPEALLGVICPRVAEMRIIADELASHGLGSELCVQDSGARYQPLSPGKPIWLSTVHGAKGLEFRALHFAGVEHVVSVGATQKRLAYTGVTRAKTALTIYHDGSLPSYFDAALHTINHSLPPGTDVGVAFGRR